MSEKLTPTITVESIILVTGLILAYPDLEETSGKPTENDRLLAVSKAVKIGYFEKDIVLEQWPGEKGSEKYPHPYAGSHYKETHWHYCVAKNSVRQLTLFTDDNA